VYIDRFISIIISESNFQLCPTQNILKAMAMHKIQIRVILLNLVHAGYLQFLVIFHNLTANEQGLLAKTSKKPIDTPK